MSDIAEGGPVKDWRDGRLVLRRPEARNSAVAKCNIEQTPEDDAEWGRAVVDLVVRRRDMTDRQRQAELDALAALAAKTRPQETP